MKRLLLALALCCFPLIGCDLGGGGAAPDHGPVDPSSRQFRLLVIEETADRPTLPASQQAIFTSTTVRQYLKSHCAKGADGAPQFRFLDKDAELSGDWKATVRAHGPRSYPWVYVTDGKTGHSGPLPNDVDSFLRLIKPFGGG